MPSDVPPSMVDDIDGGDTSSDDLQNVYDGMKHLESTGLDDVEGDNNPVHQYDGMTYDPEEK